MSRNLKNYLVFTTIPYRIMMLLVVPLCLLALEMRICRRDFFLAQMIVVLLYVTAEVIGDNWVFGGVAVKSGRHFEYLKCSKYGGKLIKAALTVNMLRQLVTMTVLSLLGFVIGIVMRGDKSLTGKQMILCVNLILLGYFMTTMQLMLTRILEGALMSIAVASAGGMVILPGYYVAARFYLMMLPVLLVLSVLASVLSIKIVMRRMEESFYDSAV